MRNRPDGVSPELWNRLLPKSRILTEAGIYWQVPEKDLPKKTFFVESLIKKVDLKDNRFAGSCPVGMRRIELKRVLQQFYHSRHESAYAKRVTDLAEKRGMRLLLDEDDASLFYKQELDVGRSPFGSGELELSTSAPPPAVREFTQAERDAAYSTFGPGVG